MTGLTRVLGIGALALALAVAVRTENSARLVYASIQGDAGTVRTLLKEGADPNSKDADGSAVLVLAAMRGNLEVVDLLLEAGASPDSASWNGITALMASVEPEDPRVFEHLAAKGADLKRVSDRGETALHFAAIKGRTWAIERLLKEGLDVNKPGLNGSTPLMGAANNGSLEAVRVLLAAGADPNAKNRDGNTALHATVADREQVEVLKALLAAGADPRIPNNLGVTPQEMAKERRNKTGARLLAEAEHAAAPRALSPGPAAEGPLPVPAAKLWYLGYDGPELRITEALSGKVVWTKRVQPANQGWGITGAGFLGGGRWAMVRSSRFSKEGRRETQQRLQIVDLKEGSAVTEFPYAELLLEFAGGWVVVGAGGPPRLTLYREECLPKGEGAELPWPEGAGREPRLFRSGDGRRLFCQDGGRLWELDATAPAWRDIVQIPAAPGRATFGA